MSSIKRMLALVLVALVALGATASAQDAAKLEEVTLARLAPSALLWVHAIAADQDFYAKHGVVIKDVQAQSSSALAQAVASGSADAGVALGDNVMRAIDEGAPLVISGAILYKPILRLIGTTDTIADLKGKRVTGGAVTGGTSDLLLYQLMQGGVQPSDVQVVGIPNSRDRLVGFQNGQLEGGLLIAPFDILALRDGYNLLDVYQDPWLETPLILNKNWAASHPAAAKGVTQAFAEAAAWIYDPANRDEAIRILAEYTGTEADVVSDAYIQPDGSDQRVSTLHRQQPRRGFEAVGFRYDPSRIMNLGSFSLQPSHVPDSAPFTAPQGQSLLGAFGASALDTWGRSILLRAERRPAKRIWRFPSMLALVRLSHWWMCSPGACGQPSSLAPERCRVQWPRRTPCATDSYRQQGPP